MGDLRERLLPGTTTTYFEQGKKGFAKIEMLLLATGGLNLSQVCAVTGLEGSTIQNWVKRGWVANPRGKKYDEVHIARILIINALKECIKLEHIALLMSYVNGLAVGKDRSIIKESELFNYLCDALEIMGQADDLSHGGVESIVETVIRDYEGPTPDSRERIRKALSVMIFACVCTDVKRRTETMMRQILGEMKSPKKADKPVLGVGETPVEGESRETAGLEAAERVDAAKTVEAPADEAGRAVASLIGAGQADTGQADAGQDDAGQAGDEGADGNRQGRKQMKISQADIERMEQRRANLYLAGKKHAGAPSADPEVERERRDTARAETEIRSDSNMPPAGDEPVAPRKTVSQALREWDMKTAEEPPESDESGLAAPSVENAVENAPVEQRQDENPEKPATKPVYFSRG